MNSIWIRRKIDNEDFMSFMSEPAGDSVSPDRYGKIRHVPDTMSHIIEEENMHPFARTYPILDQDRIADLIPPSVLLTSARTGLEDKNNFLVGRVTETLVSRTSSPVSSGPIVDGWHR